MTTKAFTAAGSRSRATRTSSAIRLKMLGFRSAGMPSQGMRSLASILLPPEVCEQVRAEVALGKARHNYYHSLAL